VSANSSTPQIVGQEDTVVLAQLIAVLAIDLIAIDLEVIIVLVKGKATLADQQGVSLILIGSHTMTIYDATKPDVSLNSGHANSAFRSPSLPSHDSYHKKQHAHG